MGRWSGTSGAGRFAPGPVGGGFKSGAFKSPKPAGGGFKSPGVPKSFKAAPSGGAPKPVSRVPLQPGIAPHKIPRVK